MHKSDFEFIAQTLRYELDLAIDNQEAYGSRAIVCVIDSLSEAFALRFPTFDSERFKAACGIGQELPEQWGHSKKVSIHETIGRINENQN